MFSKKSSGGTSSWFDLSPLRKSGPQEDVLPLSHSSERNKKPAPRLQVSSGSLSGAPKSPVQMSNSPLISPDSTDAKIAIIGESGVGKTTLLRSICLTNFFLHSSSSSSSSSSSPSLSPSDIPCLVPAFSLNGAQHIGIQTAVSPVPGRRSPSWIEWYDVSGSNQNLNHGLSLISQSSDGIVLVFDSTNKRSFEGLKECLKQVAGPTFKLSIAQDSDPSLSPRSSPTRSSSSSSLSSLAASFLAGQQPPSDPRITSTQSLRLSGPLLAPEKQSIPILFVGTKRDTMQHIQSQSQSFLSSFLRPIFSCFSLQLLQKYGIRSDSGSSKDGDDHTTLLFESASQHLGVSSSDLQRFSILLNAQDLQVFAPMTFEGDRFRHFLELFGFF